MEYLRIDPLIDTDPGLEAAGWCAARVYELLLKVSGQYDLKGRIPAERQSSTWLAKRWNLAASDLPGIKPEDFIANGIARLLETGKLVEEGDAWVIRGWEKFYKPVMTPAERKAEQRKREEEAERLRDNRDTSRNVTPVTNERDSRDCHATPHHSTPLHEKKPPTRTSALGVGGLRDGLDALFLKSKGTAFVWTSAEESRLRGLIQHGDAEILRRWAIALETNYPRCSSIRELAVNWNAYASPQANGNGPPSREVGVGRGSGGGGTCATCGEPAEAIVREKPSCYRCAATEAA